jgi:hypothetical protein
MEIPSGSAAVRRWSALPEAVRTDVLAQAAMGLPYPDPDVAETAVGWARQGQADQRRDFDVLAVLGMSLVALVVATRELVVGLIALPLVVAGAVWYERRRYGFPGEGPARGVERVNLLALMVAEPRPGRPVEVTVPARGWARDHLLAAAVLGFVAVTSRSWSPILGAAGLAIGLAAARRYGRVIAWWSGAGPGVHIGPDGLRLRRPHSLVPWAYVHGVALEPPRPARRADLTVVWVLVNGERLRVRADMLGRPPEVAMLATMSHGVPFLADPPPVPARPRPLRMRVRFEEADPGPPTPARTGLVRPVVPPDDV